MGANCRIIFKGLTLSEREHFVLYFYAFIHPFQKILFSTYYMPGSVPVTRDTAAHKIGQVLMEAAKI